MTALDLAREEGHEEGHKQVIALLEGKSKSLRLSILPW